MPEPTIEQTLDALRRHVRDAHDAARRLTPAAGWEVPDRDDRDLAGDLRALLRLLQALHTHLPEELRVQLNDLTRQVLLLARAVIEWLLAHIEEGEHPPTQGPGAGGRRERDIPIA